MEGGLLSIGIPHHIALVMMRRPPSAELNHKLAGNSIKPVLGSYTSGSQTSCMLHCVWWETSLPGCLLLHMVTPGAVALGGFRLGGWCVESSTLGGRCGAAESLSLRYRSPAARLLFGVLHVGWKPKWCVCQVPLGISLAADAAVAAHVRALSVAG